MLTSSAYRRSPAITPHSSAGYLAAVLIGVLLLSLSSYLTIPMVPVPITLQTLVVTLIGAVYGWRLGAFTVALWLLAGAAGLPVLADGSSGLQKFQGPTAGYLFAFPLAAALAGWLAQRGCDGRNLLRAVLAMLAATALCLLFGGAWLATAIGWEKALMRGVVPFLLGGVIKSVAAALLLKAGHAWQAGRIAHGSNDPLSN